MMVCIDGCTSAKPMFSMARERVGGASVKTAAQNEGILPVKNTIVEHPFDLPVSPLFFGICCCRNFVA